MTNQIIKNIAKAFFLVISFLLSYALKAESPSSDIEFYGAYATDVFKIVLGCITIIGALGFFITTSQRRSHWPASIRRTFFGIFVFCSITNQAIFNVIGLPSNKRAAAFLETV